MDTPTDDDRLFGSYTNFVTKCVLAISTYLLYRLWINGSLYAKTFRADGKVVIITGATSGVGKETALGLAHRGATVILASRSKENGPQVEERMRSESGNPNVFFMYVDLKSFASIRTFAGEFLHRFARLDILINNAEIIAATRKLSDNGLESTMAVNHFGHYLLTLLLVDRLKTSIPSRVVTVTHMNHEYVTLRKDNLNSELAFGRYSAFAQSKLANVLFTKELSFRLRNSGVTSNCVHPGFIHTELTSHLTSIGGPALRPLFDIVARLFLRSSKSGAQCSIYASLDFNLQNISGQYFRNNWFARSGKNTRNVEDARWLWQRSEEITGVTLARDAA